MANQHHLDLLKHGAPAWNEWRAKHASQNGVDLKDAFFSGAVFERYNLQIADLGYTFFGAAASLPPTCAVLTFTTPPFFSAV